MQSSLWFYYKMSLSSIFAFMLFWIIFNIQFCKGYWWWTETQNYVQFSTPEECARECRDNEAPKYCYYLFVLEYYTVNVFSINRMIPAPSIQVCKNDYVIVDLKNEAEGLETSIHWHGIFQNGYQYYDGVPYLTQCPILSANTFRYQFKVKNSGTHFYHSHESVQMMDGQYGSFIVRDPPRTNPHKTLYDKDVPEHVIVISDWFHELALERFPGRFRRNRGQTPDNFLINGRGNWTDPLTGVSTNVSLSMFIVESGKKYRYRIINAFSTVCLAEIKIERHSMQIIATDGENIQPISVDAITMASGERVDFIIHANQTPGFYWLHVRGLGECAEKQIYQLGILAYQNTSKSSLSSNPGYSFRTSSNVVSIIYRKL
ncbi:laccase-1-like [Pogonomyrmex barbatus]|uniref:Laccase-1-like n=1 Tax=Pogonomyrmex barbatus TaxID=144034 RepID=A0A6I9WS33_9HYME|nr:laccase-1-like [Pogonomyrmex barbatus]